MKNIFLNLNLIIEMLKNVGSKNARDKYKFVQEQKKTKKAGHTPHNGYSSFLGRDYDGVCRYV